MENKKMPLADFLVKWVENISKDYKKDGLLGGVWALADAISCEHCPLRCKQIDEEEYPCSHNCTDRLKKYVEGVE